MLVFAFYNSHKNLVLFQASFENDFYWDLIVTIGWIINPYKETNNTKKCHLSQNIPVWSSWGTILLPVSYVSCSFLWERPSTLHSLGWASWYQETSPRWFLRIEAHPEDKRRDLLKFKYAWAEQVCFASVNLMLAYNARLKTIILKTLPTWSL